MPARARAREWLGFWRRRWGSGGALPTRVEQVRQALLAADAARELRVVENRESARMILRLFLLGVVTGFISLFTGVWCHPSFYVALLLTAFSTRHWLGAVVPANAIVLSAWRYFGGPIPWDDLYHCAVMSLALCRRWDVFQDTFGHKKEFMALAENQAVFHKMLASVFDAVFVCDVRGVIQSSTPQLDVLLGAPGGSPKESALQGFGILQLATSDDERRRAQSFLASTAGNDTTAKITLRLNRRNCTGHQVEVTLSAIRLTRQARTHCMDFVDLMLEDPKRCVSGSSSAPEGKTPEDEALFVAVQVLEAEPQCAVVDSEGKERSPTEATAIQTWSGAGCPGFGPEAPPPEGAELPKGSSLDSFNLMQMEARSTRVKNTFVTVAESVVDTVFGEALAGREPDAMSAPGCLMHFPAESTPGARSVASHRSRRSVTREPRALMSPLASEEEEEVCASSSSPSEASEDELRREVAVSCQVQDRGLLGPGAAAVASLSRALAARREGARSVGSVGHAAGRCYPCLMEVWSHKGKAASPCKFGLFCGRCHEGHSEEQLRELRKQQRQQRMSKVARKRAQ